MASCRRRPLAAPDATRPPSPRRRPMTRKPLSPRFAAASRPCRQERRGVRDGRRRPVHRGRLPLPQARTRQRVWLCAPPLPAPRHLSINTVQAVLLPNFCPLLTLPVCCPAGSPAPRPPAPPPPPPSTPRQPACSWSINTMQAVLLPRMPSSRNRLAANCSAGGARRWTVGSERGARRCAMRLCRPSGRQHGRRGIHLSRSPGRAAPVQCRPAPALACLQHAQHVCCAQVHRVPRKLHQPPAAHTEVAGTQQGA